MTDKCLINPHSDEHEFHYEHCTWCAVPEPDIVEATADPMGAEQLRMMLWQSFNMLPKPRATRFAGVSMFVHTFLEDEVRRMDGLDAGPVDDDEKIKILLGTLNQLVLQATIED